MDLLVNKYIYNDQHGYSFAYLNREYFVMDTFVSSPSLPDKLIEKLGIRPYHAELVARGHDYIYKYRIGTWWQADTWLFKALKEYGYRFNILQRMLFRSLSWLWWIT